MAATPDYDVVIVGGGPAGSTTAKCLLDFRPDARVLLVDKAPEFPRDKPCGGFIGSQILEAFPYLQGHEDHFAESISYEGILHSPDLRYQVSGPTQMFGVLRSTFDAYLVGLAQQAGAQIGTGRRVQNLIIQDDKVVVEFADGGQISAHVVIGADGAPSIVARRSGLHKRWQSHEICRTVVKDIPVDHSFIEENCEPTRPVHIYLQFNGIPGYAWYFPKSHHINVGLGCFANYPVQLIDYFRFFLRLLKKWNMLPHTVTIRGVQAGICPIAGPIDSTQTTRVLLVGDAAGFVLPSTGAGIQPGMISGHLAALTLAEALQYHRFDAQFLYRYQIRWEQHIGRFQTEQLIQRLFLTRFCNLFIHIGERDEKIRRLVIEAQRHSENGAYGKGLSIPRLIGRVIWDSLKGAFGQL